MNEKIRYLGQHILKVVVTGAAGFIGSHVTKSLIDKGYDVVLADNFSSGSVQNLRDLGVVKGYVVGDLQNYSFARRAIKGADVVYHFAADIGNVEYLHGSGQRELITMQSNLLIDANVFRACLENKVKSLMYASSVSVYPIDEQVGGDRYLEEEDSERKVNPEGGYGWAKLIAEKQLSMMRDVHIGIARIFHAYGKNIYLKSDRSQVMASLMVKAIKYPSDKFVIWGDGRQKRCFVYIDDVIDGLNRLYEYVTTKENLTVNIGSQEEVTIDGLAKLIVNISGKHIEPEHDLTKPYGALQRRPDLKRVREKLGWDVKTSLTSGLKETYSWATSRVVQDKI